MMANVSDKGLCRCDEDLPTWQPDFENNICRVCDKPLVDLANATGGELGRIKGFAYIRTNKGEDK